MQLVAAGVPECRRRRRNRESESAAGDKQLVHARWLRRRFVRLHVFGGGTYSNCSDSDAARVASSAELPVVFALRVDPKCAPGHYYLLNNYDPGYYGDGRNAYADITNPNQTVFTIPPSSLRTIGDALIQKNISWAYYGDQWNAYLANPDNNYVTPDNTYCNICNPFQYVTSIMTSASGRSHLKDTTDLYAAIANGTLPAVSYVKPDGYLDGHPASRN